MWDPLSLGWYGTDYASAYYNRLNWVKYPDSRKIWNGYTHSGGANTFQDTINDTFGRVGQICRDNSGSKGDILAEYDFGGMSRMVRRVHDEDSGKYGNDTKLDLWQDTSGDYKGLDRFGRIIEMKFTDFSGSAVDFARLKYTYDRNSNRYSIEDVVYKANSQSFLYDNLNRLTEGRRGILDSGNAVQKSDVAENFGMDLLGNFTSAAGGVKVNSSGTSTVTHAVNATNEITTLGVPNPSGAPKLINEPFTTSLSSFWIADKGTWSISSSQVNVDTLTSGDAVLLADAKLDLINYEFKVTFPTSSSTNKAGLIFAHDGANSYHAVVLNRTTGKIALYKITSGSWGGVLASATASIADSTQYTIKVLRRQMSVDAWVVGQSTATFSNSGSTDIGTGKSGFYSDKTGVKFDDFVANRGDARDPSVPRFSGNVDMAIVSGKLVVTGTTRGGVAIADNSNGGQYRIQAVVDRNGGEAILDAPRGLRPPDALRRTVTRWRCVKEFHYTDPNNAYRLSYGAALENMTLQRVENGEWYTDGRHLLLRAARGRQCDLFHRVQQRLSVVQHPRVCRGHRAAE